MSRLGWMPAALLAACALAAAAPAHARTVKVGVSLPTQHEERWVKDRNVLVAEARRAGVDLRVEVAENDAARQAAQCERLIAEGIDVLILAPTDAARAAPIVEKATRAGIRVISYDRLVMNSPHEFHYLSFDNSKVGELQGEYLTRRVPRGTYLVLAGSPSDNNARLFAIGAMRFIKPLSDRGEIRIAMDKAVKDWSPELAERLCAEALAANPEVDAVLAPNDGTAGGCIRALAARGLAGKVPVTGQDAELAAAKRIVQGTQSMTVFKDPRALGKKAIEMAVELATGRPVETGGRVVNNGRRNVPSVLLTPEIVTRESLEATLVRSGFHPRKAVFGR